LAEPWRTVSDSILYSMQFRAELGATEAMRFAQEIVRRPLQYYTAEQEYAAIAEALQSGASLTEDMPGSPGELEYRDFLRRLLECLDALRPWPEPPLRPVDVSQWHDFAASRLVARIKLSVAGVEQHTHRAFRRTDAVSNRVLGLRLSSGAEVVLVDGFWAPDSTDIALLQRDPRLAPEQVIAEFSSAAGLSQDQVEALAS
jgi:hypothetical protein